MADSFCFLVDSLHGSAREMHGLQLWLISRSNNEKEVVKNCNKLDVSLTLKWKLAFHYEVVHTMNESRHNFTVGPLVLTKRSAVEVKLVIIPICVLIFITYFFENQYSFAFSTLPTFSSRPVLIINEKTYLKCCILKKSIVLS